MICWTGGGYGDIEGYGLGTNLARLLGYYWYNQRIVTKAGKFLGPPFVKGRGVTQGNP